MCVVTLTHFRMVKQFGDKKRSSEEEEGTFEAKNNLDI